MKIKQIHSEILFDQFFKIEAAQFKDDQTTFTRYILSRPPSAAILLYHKEHHSFIFVKQFRSPLYNLEKDPNILEIPAGVVEEGETPENTIIRETEEETGYIISSPQLITSCYSTPGIISEKFFIYFGEVTEADNHHEGGGLDEETENITVEEIKVDRVWQMLKNGGIVDAKTLLALYWFKSRT